MSKNVKLDDDVYMLLVELKHKKLVSEGKIIPYSDILREVLEDKFRNLPKKLD